MQLQQLLTNIGGSGLSKQCIISPQLPTRISSSPLKIRRHLHLNVKYLNVTKMDVDFLLTHRHQSQSPQLQWANRENPRQFQFEER